MAMNDEYQLLEPEGQTPEEVLGSKVDYKLPLPEEDREEIETRLRRRQFKRISIAELMVITTAVCLIFALSTWFRLEILSVILGVVFFAAAMVAKLAKLKARITILVLLTLICGYLVSVVAALLQSNQG